MKNTKLVHKPILLFILITSLLAAQIPVYAESLPGGMSLSIKTVYTVGESIVVNWSASTGATKYGLSVWKEPFGSNQYLVWDQYVTGLSKDIGTLPVGNYRINMKPYNSAGGGPISNIVDFSVVAASVPIVETPKPGIPNLSVSLPSGTSDVVSFTWEPTANTSNYDLRILKDNVIIETEYGIVGSNYSLSLPAGNYSAYLCSVNTAKLEWWTAGNTIDFNLGQNSNQISLQVNNRFMSVNNVLTEIENSGETYPIIVNQRVLLPVKALVEAMGGTISWNPETSEIVINYQNTQLIFKINSRILKKNGINIELDVPPNIYNKRTYVPIRALVDNLNAEVEWNGTTQTVLVKYMGISTLQITGNKPSTTVIAPPVVTPPVVTPPVVTPPVVTPPVVSPVIVPPVVAPVSNNPILPVNNAVGKWYGLTYPGHDVFGAYQYSAVDIHLPGDADKGQVIYAIQDGTVYIGDYYVHVQHSVPLTLKNGTIITNWYSMYGHLNVDSTIKSGAFVKKGTILGTISNRGTTNNHLHFVIYKSYTKSRDQAISPYWLPGDYSNGNFLYADDQNGTRDNGGESGLYENRIFSNPPTN